MSSRALILLMLILSETHFAQVIPQEFLKSSPKPDFAINIQNDFSKFYNVGINFFKSPFTYDTEDLLLSGIILSGTALSFTMDNTFRSEIGKSHGAFMDNLTPFGEEMGNPKYSVALSGIFYLGGYLIGDKELRETGSILFEAILLNGIVTQAVKMSLGRSRPYTNDGNTEMDFLEFETDDAELSLPAGHTSTAFTVATVLSERFNSIYASIALYSLAGLTAYQRIYADKHWFSDTLLGAALGTVIGLKVVKLYKKESLDNSDSYKLNITPQINHVGYGLNFSVNF